MNYQSIIPDNEIREDFVKTSKLILNWLDSHSEEEFKFYFKEKLLQESLIISRLTNGLYVNAGMCSLAKVLCDRERISEDSYYIFKVFIFKFTRRRWNKNSLFIFEPNKIQPRINYLKRVINKLEKEQSLIN